MGGVFSNTGGVIKAAQAAEEAKKLRQERDETARVAGEAKASSKRARRGGLLSEARLGGDQSTLGSAP